MLLSEIFEQLSYGELFDTNLSGNDYGGIQLENYPAVISHVNMGLTELYKRFQLEVSQDIIKLYDSIETYILDSKYAQTNLTSPEPIKYILDTVDKPFKNRVLKILNVYDDLGNEYILNNTEVNGLVINYSKSSNTSLPKYINIKNVVFTPKYNEIQVPVRPLNSTIYVNYLLDHINIPTTTVDLTSVNINISSAYLEPLTLYVAGRVIGNMSGERMNEGNNFLARFENSCKKLHELNLSTRGNFIKNIRNEGWV